MSSWICRSVSEVFPSRTHFSQQLILSGVTGANQLTHFRVISPLAAVQPCGVDLPSVGRLVVVSPSGVRRCALASGDESGLGVAC